MSTSLVSGFLGTPHLGAIVRVLGYQGVAVVMQELMEIIRSLIQGNIFNFTKILIGAMPKTCKLPLYDYGSPGTTIYTFLCYFFFSCFNSLILISTFLFVYTVRGGKRRVLNFQGMVQVSRVVEVQ